MNDDLISRQAAIEALERIFDRCEEIEAHLPKGDPDRVGYKMYPDWLKVWKYLHQLPSAQPDLQECSVWFHIGETLVDVSKMHITAEEGIEKIRSYLVRMKKPERKVATWKRIDYKPCGHDYECSSCGWKNDMETHFCPNCGARMEGEEDE